MADGSVAFYISIEPKLTILDAFIATRVVNLVINIVVEIWLLRYDVQMRKTTQFPCAIS